MQPSADELRAWRERLDTRFAQVDAVFADLMTAARARLRPPALDAYLDAARLLGKLGRGVEPMLAFLEAWPEAAEALGGAEALPALMALVQRMQRSPNGDAIAPLLQTVGAAARRLRAPQPFTEYLQIAGDLMDRTTVSIHGRHTTYPSPSLPAFAAQAPRLLDLLSLEGLRSWIDYGVRTHGADPQRQREYFALESADSRAVLQRERHGTLFADVERRLDLSLRALWNVETYLVPYSTAHHELRKPIPYFDALGMRVPDALDDAGGVRGIERYQAILAHMVGHQRWSRAQIADNWSPLQRLAVEFFEDARIDALLCRDYPGLRRIFLALHPAPREGDCEDATTSCLRHRLAMLSRAFLDPRHGYRDPLLLRTVDEFAAMLAADGGDTARTAALALRYAAASRRASDQYPKVRFDDTVIDYRDDNRHLWSFIEPADEAEDREAPQPAERDEQPTGLPPRLYHEWDWRSQSYRPDWVSVYEALHPGGDAGVIDALLRRHQPLAKRLKRLFDLLKPQDKVRIRYQEQGSELDLDVALRSLVDFKSGAQPDPRINMSHRTDGRDIAVLLLLDLSRSLGDTTAGTGQTLLELSREAVSLLGWAVEQLGDPFAIAGFHSDTRHDVRYQHIKGFSEHWGDECKARLAAMRADGATRIGAAMRHAAHYLGARRADKKLLLVLTDGRPADADVQDPQLLVHDARRAVTELDRDGIFTYCISLDPAADEYVHDIFDHRYTVIDNVGRLPEKLPELFVALTG